MRYKFWCCRGDCLQHQLLPVNPPLSTTQPTHSTKHAPAQAGGKLGDSLLSQFCSTLVPRVQNPYRSKVLPGLCMKVYKSTSLQLNYSRQAVHIASSTNTTLLLHTHFDQAQQKSVCDGKGVQHSTCVYIRSITRGH